MSPRRSLAAVLAVAALLGAGSIGGCAGTDPAGSQSGTSAGPQLPRLSPTQRVRDEVARSEAAIATASQTLADLATRCSECAAALTQTATDAQARLAVAGGQWSPWPEADAEELAELPAPLPVGDAPLQPNRLVGYLWQTARTQLEELAGLNEVDSAERNTLAAVLLGRLASAQQLAKAYAVDAKTEAEALEPEATLTSAGPADPAGTTGAPSSSQSGPQSGGDVEQSVAQSYDCLSSTFGTSPLLAQDPAAEQKLYDELIRRQVQLAQTTALAQRPARCALEFSTVDDLFAMLLATDIDLLNSPNDQVRQWAEEWLSADLGRWSQFGTVPTVTPGLRSAPTTPATENEADDEQS